jgi:hypothetical protein
MSNDSSSIESTTTTTFFPQQSVLSCYQCSSKSSSSCVPNDGYTIFIYKTPLSNNQHPPPFFCIFTSNQAHPLLSSKIQARLSTIDIDTESAAAASIRCMPMQKRTRAARGVYYISRDSTGKFLGGEGEVRYEREREREKREEK